MIDTGELLKIGAGRQAEIFACDDRTVLKLYFSGENVAGLDAEEAAMRAAHAAGAPVPAVVGRVERDGRLGIVIERAEGIDLLTQLDRKPWTVFSAGPAMGRAHAALHETIAPPALPSLKEKMPAVLAHSPLVPERIRDAALDALDALPDGDRLCHGDFHPGNIVLTAAGPIVLDWPNAVRGDPHADVARALLVQRMGEPPEGVSALLRALTGIGRRIILRSYCNTYRKHRPLDAGLLARWEFPVAAHRLTENIVEERERLLALLDAQMPRE